MSEQLTTEERWAIVAFSTRLQFTSKHIADLINSDPSTVTRTLKRFRETGDVENRYKSGRRSLICVDNIYNNFITNEISKNRQITSRGIATNLARDYHIYVSDRTVRRLRFQLKYRQVLFKICPKLTDLAMKKRLTYARKYANHIWNDVVFSDEKMFTLNKEGIKIWKRSDEPSIVAQQPLHCFQVMVWGGIWMDGKTTLHITTSTIDGDEYQNIIYEHLIQAEACKDKSFQQDNAPAHKSKKTINFLEENDITLIKDYPPYSPELNPIEKVWSWMSASVRRYAPQNEEELVEAIDMSWQELPQETIRNYINHLPTVCELIKQSGGASIVE